MLRNIASHLIIISLAFISISCAGTMYMPRDTVKIENDEFSNEVTVLGIEKKFPPSTNINYHFIRSWVNKKDDSVSNQLYINRQYGDYDWHFYNRASLEGGKDLPFTNISRNVLSCSGYGSCEHQEIFGLDLETDFLRENKNGFDVKIYAKSGDSFVISVTPEQVQNQLSKIENITG